MLNLFVRLTGENTDRVFLNREYDKSELEELIREKCQHLSTEEQHFILTQGEVLEEDGLVLDCEEDVVISCNYEDLTETAHEDDKIQIFAWGWYHVEKGQRGSVVQRIKEFLLS